MARKPKDVTDAELAIMHRLWDGEASTVKQLTQQLYPANGPSQNATVQKLLERLEQKQCVKRNRDSWPHTFRATVNRDELITRQLQETADKLCAGSLTPLLTQLVKGTQLSAEERSTLRQLLNELDDS